MSKVKKRAILRKATISALERAFRVKPISLNLPGSTTAPFLTALSKPDLPARIEQLEEALEIQLQLWQDRLEALQQQPTNPAIVGAMHMVREQINDITTVLSGGDPYD
jgi:hypothetical protein